MGSNNPDNFADLRGKTALITGASAGIGEEFAHQLHAAGCGVILVARRFARLEQLCETLNALRPKSAAALKVDLGSEELLIESNSDSDFTMQRTLEEFISANRIDLLVNNAGFGTFGHFSDSDLNRELELIRVNVMAPVRLSRAVIPQMKSRKSGAIINVSSIAGFQAVPYLSTYGASKGFNLLHSLALREELRTHGIRVVALCPGPTATEFGQVANYPGSLNSFKRDTVPKVVADTLTALRRNRAYVIPTLSAKLIALPAKFLPRSIIDRITGLTIRYSTGICR